MSAFDYWLKDGILDNIEAVAIEEYEKGNSVVEVLEELHRITSVSIERAIYNVIDLSDRDKEKEEL
jgi:hypothetical protein